MGGSQSTRKVTVDNENAIQVSQEALDRISAQLSSKVALPCIQICKQSHIIIISHTTPDLSYKYASTMQEASGMKQAEQPEPQGQPSHQLPPPPPPYDARKQQDHAAEEAYWARRIENLKRAHEKISLGMKNEYQKTLHEANELFDQAQQDKIVNKLPPCQEEKSKVLDCYSSNPGQSLMCSIVVNQFNDCVCKSRVSALASS